VAIADTKNNCFLPSPPGKFAPFYFSPRSLRYPEPAISGTFQETSVDLRGSYLHFIAAFALLYRCPQGRVNEIGEGVCSSVNDNFRELLGVVAVLVLYLGMLWFVLLKHQNVPEVTGTEVVQAQQRDRQRKGSPKPSQKK